MKRILSKIALVTAVVAVASSAHAGTIVQKGSDTIVILAQKWAEVYMSKNPDTKIQVTGGGWGVGVAAHHNPTPPKANSSRPIRPPEIAECIKAFSKRPLEVKAALDGLTVYLHESNPVSELTLEQLERLFTGKIKNWKEVGGPDLRVTVYSRENSSGTYEFFKEHVLKGRDFAASAQTMPGSAAVLQAVAKDRGAIGYSGAAYGKGAKHIKVKRDDNSPAIEPNEENVVKGTYPIWRYLYIYLNPNLNKGEVASYLNWIRSDEGQKLVKDVGYFPLPAHLRDQSVASK
jgi:phosphate transport system substrate-binding protein